MRQIALPLMLIALTQCGSPTPTAAPSPPPAPPRAPPAPPQSAPASANWEDWPPAPGNWSYARDDGGSRALFGPAGADAVFVVRCALPARRIYVSRQGQLAAGDAVSMTLRATSGWQSYPLANSSAAPPYVSADLAPADRQLDALAHSRGRFLVSVKSLPDLVIPAWPEFARVVEDCRN